MFGTALIVFREVLEAALIIGIVSAATRGIEVEVPAGIANGQRIRLAGRGHAGEVGARDRVPRLAADPSAEEQASQRRCQRDRQECRRKHHERLGAGERPEQTSGLAGERDERRTVQERVADGGDEVHRARPERPEADAGTPREASVHVGHVGPALLVSDRPATATAVFTTNRAQAAPVLVSRDHLAKSGGVARAIVVNSGCANATTRTGSPRNTASK